MIRRLRREVHDYVLIVNQQQFFQPMTPSPQPPSDPPQAPAQLLAATRNCLGAASWVPGGGRECCPLTVMRSARHDLLSARAYRVWGPSSDVLSGANQCSVPEEGRVKSAEEIMQILEAFDLTGSYRDAAELTGCSHHTVAHYVRAREEGRLTPGRAERRPMLIDPFLPKLEEWLERSKGKIRADVAHDKLVALGYTGSQRTTRRAVA